MATIGEMILAKTRSSDEIRQIIKKQEEQSARESRVAIIKNEIRRCKRRRDTTTISIYNCTMVKGGRTVAKSGQREAVAALRDKLEADNELIRQYEHMLETDEQTQRRERLVAINKRNALVAACIRDQRKVKNTSIQKMLAVNVEKCRPEQYPCPPSLRIGGHIPPCTLSSMCNERERLLELLDIYSKFESDEMKATFERILAYLETLQSRIRFARNNGNAVRR